MGWSHPSLGLKNLRGLREWFESLTEIPRVAEAAIFPVSAFGFGTAQELPGTDRRPANDLSYGEREWVLRREAEQRPYNVTTLVIWSLLAALRQRPISNAEEQTRVCQQLQDTLDRLAGWHIPVKDR